MIKLTEKDIMENSFVLSTTKDGAKSFNENMRENGFTTESRPYVGRYVNRNSLEYHFNRHFIAAHGSHFEICEKAIAEDLPFVCVFEEDAIPCIGVHEKLERYLSEIPDDASIFKFGYVPFNGFKYKDRKLDDIEPITDIKYRETYIAGSHSYIIFKKFYNTAHEMYQTFLALEKYKDYRSIHNPMYFTSEQLKHLWLFEWLMAPNVYRNDELQKNIYSVNPNDNPFTQPAYITWNQETESLFKRR